MRYLMLILLLCLVGCSANPISQSQTNNPEIKVNLLFEHDGIKVYRFEDGGYNRYFTNKGECINTTTVTNGKTTYQYQSEIN